MAKRLTRWILIVVLIAQSISPTLAAYSLSAFSAVQSGAQIHEKSAEDELSSLPCHKRPAVAGQSPKHIDSVSQTEQVCPCCDDHCSMSRCVSFALWPERLAFFPPIKVAQVFERRAVRALTLSLAPPTPPPNVIQA